MVALKADGVKKPEALGHRHLVCGQHAAHFERYHNLVTTILVFVLLARDITVFTVELVVTAVAFWELKFVLELLELVYVLVTDVLAASKVNLLQRSSATVELPGCALHRPSGCVTKVFALWRLDSWPPAFSIFYRVKLHSLVRDRSRQLWRV